MSLQNVVILYTLLCSTQLDFAAVLENPREAFGGGIFDSLLNVEICQPEVASDVISSLAS